MMMVKENELRNQATEMAKRTEAILRKQKKQSEIMKELNTFFVSSQTPADSKKNAVGK